MAAAVGDVEGDDDAESEKKECALSSFLLALEPSPPALALPLNGAATGASSMDVGAVASV